MFSMIAEGGISFPYFLHCSFAFDIWSRVLQKWNLCWVFPQHILDCFKQWRYPSSNSTLRMSWSFIFPHVSWGIWKERNNHIFRDSSLQTDVVVEKVCRAISKNINVVFSVVSSFSSILSSDYESVVSKEWRVVMSIIQRHVKKTRDGCVWIFPPLGWVKINFDGEAKGNTESVGCGGVIRDEHGRLIVAVALPMGT